MNIRMKRRHCGLGPDGFGCCWQAARQCVIRPRKEQAGDCRS